MATPVESSRKFVSNEAILSKPHYCLDPSPGVRVAELCPLKSVEEHTLFLCFNTSEKE